MQYCVPARRGKAVAAAATSEILPPQESHSSTIPPAATGAAAAPPRAPRQKELGPAPPRHPQHRRVARHPLVLRQPREGQTKGPAQDALAPPQPTRGFPRRGKAPRLQREPLRGKRLVDLVKR